MRTTPAVPKQMVIINAFREMENSKTEFPAPSDFESRTRNDSERAKTMAARSAVEMLQDNVTA